MSRVRFFIVGCPRSGTTLLQRILDTHDSIAVSPETHFMHRYWRNRQAYGDLENTASMVALLNDMVASQEMQDLQLNWDETWEQALALPDPDYGSLFNLLLLKFGELRDKELVGEKTPNHVLYLVQLAKFFPEARFVHIVRDPRAVANSWKNYPWTNGAVWKDAIAWQLHVKAATRAEKAMPERVMTIKYEDLVQKVEQVVPRICSFIGAEYSEALLAYHLHAAPHIDVGREPWKKNVNEPLIRSAVNKWQDALSPEEIQRIESVVYDDMLRFGYVPQNTRRAITLPSVVNKTRVFFWRGRNYLKRHTKQVYSR